MSPVTAVTCSLKWEFTLDSDSEFLVLVQGCPARAMGTGVGTM